MGEAREDPSGGRVVLAVVMVCFALLAGTTNDRFVLAQKPGAGPNAAALLDRYAAGAHEVVAQELAAVRDFEMLSRDLERLVPDWLARVGAGEKFRRSLVAATFLLEVAHAGLETDWGHLNALVELGCRLIRSDAAPTEIERVWMLASIALAGGGRARAFLIGGPTPPVGPAPREHLKHARSRFPDEPRFELAMAVAEEFASPGELPRAATPFVNSEVEQGQAVRRRNTIQRFTSIARIPLVAAEAEMHLGYLWFQARNNREALAHLKIAHEKSSDPFVTYLARFFAGRVLLEQKQQALAEAAFRDALSTLPGTQSASEALAALLFVDGRRDEAYGLVEASFSRRPLPPDPWRLYGYGDFRRWPDLVRQLREAIR